MKIAKKKPTKKAAPKPRVARAVRRDVSGDGAVTTQDLAEIRAYAAKQHGPLMDVNESVDQECPACNPKCETCGSVNSKTRFITIATAVVEMNEHGQQSGGMMALDGHGYTWQYWPARYGDEHRLLQKARWVRMTAVRKLGKRDDGAVRDVFVADHD